MRVLVLLSLLPLGACAWDPDFSACAGFGQPVVDVNRVAYCAGFEDRVRVESLVPGENGNFAYAAQTNTVLTENDDGVAERIRRDWLAQALRAHAMCEAGYVVDTRRLVQRATGPFANGGDIVYAGRCL
jgi:hypothetical protein